MPEKKIDEKDVVLLIGDSEVKIHCVDTSKPYPNVTFHVERALEELRKVLPTGRLGYRLVVEKELPQGATAFKDD